MSRVVAENLTYSAPFGTALLHCVFPPLSYPEAPLLADRIPAIFAVAGALAVPSAHGQTLLWSARYDSGGDDQLGAGRPFRVEGSGAVTLAGQVGDDFLMVRYLPDGAFDKSRIQRPAPPFGGNAVTIDREGRAVWAGYPAAGTMAGDQAILLVRLGFTGSPEALFSTFVGPVQGWYGGSVNESGDGGLLLGYHLYGHAALSIDYVSKVGGTGPGWTVQDGGNLCGGQLVASAPSGGAVVSLYASARSVQRIDPTGALVWSHSCMDAGWPWQGNPYLGVVDDHGNLWAAGRSNAGDILTARLDPSGALVWQRSFDGSGHGIDAPTDLVMDVGGSLYVTGSSVGGGGTTDYATVKYDPSGNLLWTRTFDDSSDDVPVGIAVDGAGNAWVTGTSGNDVVTLKYDPSGTQVFSQRFVSPGAATVAGVAVDGWGNATVAFSAAGDIFVLRYGQAPVEAGPLSFRTVDPCRAFDSREATLGGPSPLAGPSDHVIALAGVCGVPASAKAVSLNVTVVGATQPGSLGLFPADQTPSATSAINYSTGQTRANNATVGLGTNAGLGLRVSQGGGSVHVLIDVVGYWQ